MATVSEQPTQIQPRVPTPPAGGPGSHPRDPRSVSPGGPGEPPVPPRRTGGGGGGGGGGHDGGPGSPGDAGPNRTRLYSALGLAIVLLAAIGVFAMGGGGEDDARIADSTPSQQTTPEATPTPEVTPAPTPEPEATPTPEADDSAQATQPQEETGGVAVGGAGQTGDAADAEDAEAESNAPLLTAGAVADVTVKQGDTVRFRVTSDTAQEVHVHGYDRRYDLAAGETQTIAFPADLTGIFEIEFEETGTQIGELTVEP